MESEIKSHTDKNTWTLVKRPPNTKVINRMWILTEKREGESLRYKARYVAKSFSQRQGIDYDQTYAPVVHQQSIRVLISHAIMNGSFIRHVDIKTAYLNSELDEQIYMNQPFMFERVREWFANSTKQSMD
jgi:predicted nuclease of restriction endonuclease-like (RecB) superfamily